MSQKYTGGFITKSPVAPTSSAASGIWTLDQQQQAQKAGTWPSPPIFIEDLFSTYLYTGNGSTQTITNGIDLSGQGGLVWYKSRSNVTSHGLIDTARGMTSGNSPILVSNTDASQVDISNFLIAGSTGFTLGSNTNFNSVNASGLTYVSWTFREQPKFFDVVTFTKSSSPQTISHNLGSTPGCIFIKRTDSSGAWLVAHRGYTGGITAGYTLLNTTAAFTSDANAVTAADSTTFTLGSSVVSGDFVAYLFAHDAGGFPVSGGGSTNGISCGSFNSTAFVDLGYEPQWLMYKRSSGVEEWNIADNMRGFNTTNDGKLLFPNSSAVESASGSVPSIQSTGFTPSFNGAGATYIYIAIRRGPMKPPTVGTSVFQPTVWTGTGAALQQNVNINYDAFLQFRRNGGYFTPWMDKLRGFGYSLYTQSTNAEGNQTAYIAGPKINNYINFVDGTYNLSSEPWLNYAFVRAPGFFDEVCYTGTEVSGQTFNHNLGAVPEMMIVKSRSGTTDWTAYHSALGASARIYPNATNAANTGTAAPWNSTTPTSSVFSLGNAAATNLSGATFVNYLFATLAGISKVGSYTGTGALQTVNCGFTSGARFVLIKRTDSTGDWYVYDSTRGLTSGNDPYLFLNSTASEVTGTNYVDTDTTGFQVTAAAPAGLNANGGTYIFLAIA